MNNFKIALGQINPTVGDIEGNKKKIIDFYFQAVKEQADLVVFPECALTGYPIGDIVYRNEFMKTVQTAIDHIHDLTFPKTILVFGTPRIDSETKEIRNSMVFLRYGEQQFFQDKVNLPNYGVFNDARVFSPGKVRHVVPRIFIKKTNTVNIGFMICEDAWHSDVTKQLSTYDTNFIICINGSPYESNKEFIRHENISERMKEIDKPFIYLNLVGGQDNLVFDGSSFIHTPSGLSKQFSSFKEELIFVEYDLDSRIFKKLEIVPKLKPELGLSMNYSKMYQAMVLGLRDFVIKNNFKSVILGMSGGIDSALVAAIASDAIGPFNVNLIRLPSKYSSEHSLSDAELSAYNMGANLETVDIEPVVSSIRSTLSISNHILTGLTDENIQARARMIVLMALSNQLGSLLLSTGNRSEFAVGYSTIYGDQAGGFNPIIDCYKSQVFEICKWRNSINPSDYGFLGNHNNQIIPDSIINKAPSAELKPDQKDQDFLPEYDILDDILFNLLEKNYSIDDTAKTLDQSIELITKISNMLHQAEFKRQQACPGVKLSTLSFAERLYPISNKWRK